jgi:putative transposase
MSEVYHDIRARFDLSAQMTIRAISKVVEVYKRDRRLLPKFRPHGAIVYDQRILSWKGPDRVSILTLGGRLVVPWVAGAYQQARDYRKFRVWDRTMLLKEPSYAAPQTAFYPG